MESVDLQMEDIFDGPEDVDDDLFTNHASIPDLPPDEGPGEGGADNIQDDAVLARLRDLSKGAAKRTVKRVQPKLDPARLTGDRGIGELPKVFKDVKFKGKGHEADDLKKIMRYLEHWAHRLFPKMPFDEVLERIERLGTKREVQTYIKRMRLDIPIENEQNMVVDEEDIFDTSTASETKQDKNLSGFGNDDEEMLDELMREEEQIRQSQVNHPTPVVTSHAPCPSTPVTPATKNTPTASTPGGLTAEQRERIEANKRRAHERRLARLGMNTPGTPGPPILPAQVNTPLAYPPSPSVTTPVTVTPSQGASASTRASQDPADTATSPTGPILMDTDQLDEDQLLADLEADVENETAPPLSIPLPESAEQETQPPDDSHRDQSETVVTSPCRPSGGESVTTEQAKDGDKPSQDAPVHSAADGDEPSQDASVHSAADGDKPSQDASVHLSQDTDKPSQDASVHLSQDTDKPSQDASVHLSQDTDKPSQDAPVHSSEESQSASLSILD